MPRRQGRRRLRRLRRYGTSHRQSPRRRRARGSRLHWRRRWHGQSSARKPPTGHRACKARRVSRSADEDAKIASPQRSPSDSKRFIPLRQPATPRETAASALPRMPTPPPIAFAIFACCVGFTGPAWISWYTNNSARSRAYSRLKIAALYTKILIRCVAQPAPATRLRALYPTVSSSIRSSQPRILSRRGQSDLTLIGESAMTRKPYKQYSREFKVQARA